MRAAVVTRFGGPEVFELAELPDPVPGPGQVAIDVTYAAVGLVDIYIRQGLYKDRPGLPQPPYVPGLEVAGTIRALGDGVEGFDIAEPVVTLSGTGAEEGYASVTVADAAMTVSLDGTGIGPAAAVAAVPNAATAHAALTEVAHLSPSRYYAIRGRVINITTEGGADHVEALAQRYLGAPYPWYGGRDQIRVILTIRADTIRAMGQARHHHGPGRQPPSQPGEGTR